MKIKLMFLLTLLVLVALAACAPAPTPAPTAAPPTAAPKPTDVPKPTVAPTVASSSSSASSVASASSSVASSSSAASSSASSSASAAATKPAAGPTNTAVPTATPRPPAVTAAAGAIKIQFWHHFSDPTQVDMIQRFADEFNGKNPKYYIVPTFQGNVTGDMARKVNAAITAGATPDIVTGNPGDFLDYANQGVMTPLDALLKDPTNGLDAATLAGMSFKLPNGQELFFDVGPDGKTYGISPGRSMEVMYYNVDMLKAAGFNNPPATWDDFDKVCAAITKGDNYCVATNSPSVDTSGFATWVFSRGGTYASQDEKKATFDDAAGVDTLKWLKNGVDKGWFKNPSTTNRGDQTDFGNGKLAFTFGTSAGMPFYQDIVAGLKQPFQWSVAPIPAGPKGKPVVDFFGPSIGIMKTTADKQLGAWLFLKNMFQSQNLVEFGLRLSYYPATQSARDQVAGMDSDKVKAINPRIAAVLPQYKAGLGLVSMGVREPTAAAWQGVRSIIASMLTAVYTGKTSADFTATDAEAAAKEGVQRVNKSLDAYGK